MGNILQCNQIEMCDNFVRYLNQKNVVAYQLNRATKEKQVYFGTLTANIDSEYWK